MGEFKFKTFAAVAVFVLAAGQVSCLPPGGSEDPCVKTFETEIAPDEIRGSTHIYVPAEKLAFMDDPATVIASAELQVTLRGRQGHSRDISLSLNGLKISRRDGGPLADFFDSVFGADRTRTSFSLHKMFLNGAMPFHLFIAKVKRNKGQLKISLLGPNIQIEDARLVFKGRRPEPDCTPGGGPGGENPGPAKPGQTVINAIVPADSPTRSTTIQFTFSNPISGLTFYCALDRAPATRCQSPQVYSSLANGAHTFRVYAMNSKGETEPTPAQHTWTVDTIAPQARITNASELTTLTNNRSIRFTVEGNEPGQLVCSLDGAAFAPCQTPVTYADLGEGVHSFAVNLIDRAGNPGVQPARFDWRVDLTAPVTTLLAVVPAEAVSNSTDKSFNFAADESALFECSLDNGPFATCVSPAAFAGLNEGRHWFSVRARDLAGNTGVAASYAWNVDLTAPELTLVNVAPTVGVTRARSVMVDFALSEPGVVRCSWDDAPAVECTSPYTIADVTEGAHRLRVEGQDLAGNSSAGQVLEWTMDFTSPQISFASLQPAASVIGVQTLTAAIDSSEGASLSVSLNGRALAVTSSPIVLSGLTEGDFDLAVSARDSAGNVSNTITHSFRVDLTAPQINLVPLDTRDPVNLDSRSFTFTASEPVRFECELDDAGFAECASPTDLAGLADGTHRFRVRAVDAAGNSSATADHVWTIDTRAPTVRVQATVSGGSASFELSADEAPVTFECALDGGSYQPCPSPAEYAGLSTGPHLFRARATDAAGNTSPGGTSFAFDVILPIQTFIDEVTPSDTLTRSQAIGVIFSANQQATFVCSLDGQPAQPCTSPATFAGLADGGHTLRVSAIDRFGNLDPVGATHSWTVDTIAPVVSGLSFTTTTNTITVTWTTNEPATSQVLYGVGATVNASTTETATRSTVHSVRLIGLSSNTLYVIQVGGRDAAGNMYLDPSIPRSVRTNR